MGGPLGYSAVVVHLLQKRSENMSSTLIKKSDLIKAYYPDGDGNIVCQGCTMEFQKDSAEMCLCGMTYNEIVQANADLWDLHGDAVTDVTRLTDDELQEQYKMESKDNKQSEFVALFRELETKVHNANMKELSKETRKAVANSDMIKYVTSMSGKASTELGKKSCNLKYTA